MQIHILGTVRHVYSVNFILIFTDVGILFLPNKQIEHVTIWGQQQVHVWDCVLYQHESHFLKYLWFILTEIKVIT